MLNKELLITGITRKEPHVILTVDEGYIVSQSADGYGYDKYSGIGMISRIPCWVFNDPTKLQTLGTVPESYQTVVSWDELFYSKRLVITRLDTGRSVEFVNTDSYTYGLRADDASFFTRADIHNEIPLIFDPPRLLFGSRYGQTDLGIGYYVEEVLWEAQNAEQGTSDDRWCRGVVDSTIKFHRGLLYRSNPMGLNRSGEYPLGRKSEHGYCNDSNTSKEYPTTYTKCRTLQGHNRRWVYSRRLLQTRNSNHSESKRGVSRGALQSVISKEALYA